MTIARTPSEARLASLHLNFSELNLKRPAPLISSTHQSRLTDDDLEGLEFPSLGTSVLEEQETRFAMLASKALNFLATPEADPREVYSPYTNRSPLPDCEADANPYFTSKRNLYHDGTDSWTPRSFASSSSSSSVAESDYSSAASSYDTPEPSSPTPALSHKASSLAARRGKSLNIVLPPTPNVLAEQQRTARSTAGFALSTAKAGGVLKNNFAGVSLGGGVLQDEIEGPLSPTFRRRPRAHGFAF